jgi:hypothetical protein
VLRNLAERATEPVTRLDREQLGPDAQMRESVTSTGAFATAIQQAPQLIEKRTRISETLSDERAAARASGPGKFAVLLPLWISAEALIVIAVKLLAGWPLAAPR